MLQGKWKVPGQGARQERLKEQAGGWIAVVLQQARDAPVSVHAGVAAVEAEALAALFYAGVQRAAVASKADREQVVVLGRVPEQESALRLPFEKLLGFEAVKDAPVTGAVVDLEEIRH